MASIIGGLATSHVPAIGAALDNGRTGEPYWQPLFEGFALGVRKQNHSEIMFARLLIPTFALGCGAEFRPADEGWGPRPVPTVIGEPELAAHVAQALILDEFDLTIVNQMDVDHGLTVPLSLVYGQPAAWPGTCGPECRRPSSQWNLQCAVRRALRQSECSRAAFPPRSPLLEWPA